MGLPPIDYLRWAIRTHGHAEIEMAASGMPAIDPGSLGTIGSLDDHGAFERFAEAVAGWLALPVDEVLPTLGTSQALWLAVAASTAPGDVVLVEHPTYEPLRRVAEGLGRRVELLPRLWSNRWEPDLATAERVAATGARLIVVSDPHNPSGVRLTNGALERLAAVAQRVGARILVDEVYRYLDRTAPSSRRVAPNVIAIGSLTKVFGLGWAKAGWLLGPADVVQRASHALLHIGLNPPSHAVIGCAALARREALLDRADAIVADKPALVDGWIRSRDDVDWVLPTRTLFGFPRFATDTAELCRGLHEHEGVLLGPGAFFGEPRHVRLSWGISRELVERGLERIGRSLDRARTDQESPIV